MGTIKTLDINHEMILNWMLLNPGSSQSECAAHFGLSEAWVSRIKNSDVFQAALQSRYGELRQIVHSTIPEQLKVATSIALDKVTDDLVNGRGDEDYRANTMHKLLQASGYAPTSQRSQGNETPQVTINIDANLIEEARKRRMALAQPEENIIDVQPTQDDNN